MRELDLTPIAVLTEQDIVREGTRLRWLQVRLLAPQSR